MWKIVHSATIVSDDLLKSIITDSVDMCDLIGNMKKTWTSKSGRIKVFVSWSDNNTTEGRKNYIYNDHHWK